MAFTNDIAFITPSRPVFHSQLFDIPVLGHATYSVAAYSVRCEVGDNLAIESVNVDASVWIAEIRPLDFLSTREVGVVAILSNPEEADETMIVQPQLLFSLQVRVLQSAQAEIKEPINCTTAYLSNIYNEKIQPRGQVTPLPALSISHNSISPGLGEVTIAQSLPRGMFSYAEQSQIVNTAVLNEIPFSLKLTHLVAMSSGTLVNASNVQCSTDSIAFQLSKQCNQIIFDGTEPVGTSGDTISTTYLNFTSLVSVRVWYPKLPLSVQVSPPTLKLIEGWFTLSELGICSQQYQQATLDVYAEFSYNDPESPVFIVSVLPLISHLLNSSNSEVVVVSDDRSSLTALSPGTSTIYAQHNIPPTIVTVTGDSVSINSLDITVFSGLRINLPASPYAQLSTQTASVDIDQVFDSFSTPVFMSFLLILGDGSSMVLDHDLNNLTIASLDQNVIKVSSNQDISLLGSGSGDIVQVTLSSCTGHPVITGNGSIEVTVPNPLRLDIIQSSMKLTYPEDMAAISGIPVSISTTLSLVFPGGLTRDATNDPLTTYRFLQGEDLVVMTSSFMFTPSDPNREAIGRVIVSVSYESVNSNIIFDVVTYQGIQLFARPYPSYPGSDLISKSTLFQIENTGQYQQATLELQAILSDNSSITVTQSPLALYQATSPSVIISGNIVQAFETGTYSIQGHFGPNVSSIELMVSNSSIFITALREFSLQLVNNTFSGTPGSSMPLNLDVIFSDMTQYLSFIPNSTGLFPQIISLTIDTPSAASINPLTGYVTLQSNHHSPVTITASATGSTQLQSLLHFTCNLQPAVGDVDLGETNGVPISPVLSGSNFSVPLVVNAGEHYLGAVQLTLVYSSQQLSILSVSKNSSWLGDLQYVDTPSTGLLVITASSESGVAGLVRLGTIEFMSLTPGMGSIGGVISQFEDTQGNPVGGGTPRQFIAGQVLVNIMARRSQRQAKDIPHLRFQRNAQCTFSVPCDICPELREEGDVNGDCIFNADDVQFLLQYHAENLFDFRLDSGLSLQTSLITAQQQELDSDLNTALDPQDVYFLHQVQNGLLNFLTAISIEPIQDSSTCQLSINATLTEHGNTTPNPAQFEVFFDVALVFDPSFTSQRLFDDSVVILGSLVTTANKGLTLQGGVLQASQLEPGVFGIVLETNLTMSGIGISVIQSTSSDMLSTNQARTRAMFGSPDPPFSFPNPLAITLPSFSDLVNVRASQGYTSFSSFNNSMSTLVCITPSPPPVIGQPLVQATVPENISIGIEVLRISAQSQSDHSEIYSISSGNVGSVFAIGSNDGVISVVLSLDYESVNFYRLQILATDPATGFSSSAMAEISVTDVNDNPPIFLMFNRDISLPANLPVGSVVLTVMAQDADDGSNAAILYTTEGNDFAISQTTGIVTLERRLDFNSQDMHLVNVTATDMGDPPLSSSIILNVSVLAPDPTILQFNSSIYYIFITENSAIGLEVLQLRAIPISTDSDEATVKIDYALDFPSNVPFRVDAVTGILTVNGTIDRENIDSYELTVSARVQNNSRAVTALAVVLVSIQDLNDNSPVFNEANYRATAVEEMPAGSLSITVMASDPDLGLNGTIEYSLSVVSSYFSIDNSTGVLTNTNPLDFEETREITVLVIATDLGMPPRISFVNVTISIQDINDNPPVLVVMPDFITINESIDIGTVLAIATVTDRDSQSVNGAVILSLTSQNSNNTVPEFDINSMTGEITSSTNFDYETIQRYDLTVTATDSISPAMNSRYNLTIVISDVNDNPPMFDQDIYNVSLNENLPVNSQILILTASDADSGVNADVEFTVMSIQPPSSQFTLNSNGSLEVVGPLNFEMTQFYTIRVMVENTISGTEADFATVYVEVIDFNEFPPSFSQNVYQTSVVEEVVGAEVIQVVANDSDLSDSVSFFVNNSNFRIDSDGTIFTNGALDRESVGQYNFTVVAMDNGIPVMSSSALVIVDVSDINDNNPVFNPFQNISILESTPVGSEIITFSASDADDETNGTIGSFFLTSPFQDFSLNPNGKLTVAHRLNASSISQYVLTIEVGDLGSPPLNATAILVITIDNSPAPFFEQSTYSTSILENNEVNTFLVQVKAISQNIQTAITEYHLVSSSLSHLFYVDPASGNVTAIARLDREDRDMYSIEVGATAEFNSTALTATTEVNITVLDVNDNPPMFVFPSVFVTINETTRAGTPIAMFEANDIDLADNAIIEYSILSGNNELQLTIDHNGTLTTTTSLIAMHGLFNITIQAANLIEFGSLSSTTNLQIVVMPVNNFSPTFNETQYSVSVNEDALVGTVIATVSAVDTDLGSAGEVFYNISSGNEDSTFAIDHNAGNIILERTLDFEFLQNYNISLVATDDGIPPRSSQSFLNIQVTDINDNPPLFTQQIYVGSLDENLPAGQSILRVMVEDADTPLNSLVTYEILPSDLSLMFRINASGVLENSLPLDHEVQDSVLLTIIALNVGFGRTLNSTTIVNVSIGDINDNAPIFSEDEYSTIQQAPIPANVTIIQVQANDIDSLENSRIQFSLQNSNNTFYVDPVSGVIQTLSEISLESNFSLTVIASDSGSPVLSSQSLIQVIVLAPNDLTAGRERDIVFTTEEGISLLGSPHEVTVNSFQQMYGFVVGRNNRQSREVSVNLNTLSSTLSVMPAELEVDNVKAVLISNEIWHDEAVIQLVVQARDRTHNVHVVTSVIAQVTHFTAGMVHQSCTTRSSDGTCMITIPLPAIWFESRTNVTVEFGLSSTSLQLLGEVEVQPRPLFTVDSNVYTFMEMPFKPLFLNDGFFIPVYGRTGSKAVGSYTITVQGSITVRIIGLTFNSTIWRAQTLRGSNSNITITAVRSDQSATPPAEEILLFTIQAQVSTLSQLDTLITSAVTYTVEELSDFDRLRLLPLPGMEPGQGFALSRNGITNSGAIYVAGDNSVGILPYVNRADLINTALLNGVAIYEPIIILNIHRSSHVTTLLELSRLSCMSGNSSIVDVIPNCANISLTPNQTIASASTSVSVTYDGQLGSFPVQVWLPQMPLHLVVADDTLNILPEIPDSRFNCSAIRQFSSISVFAQFTNSEESIQNVDITNMVSNRLFSSDSSIVAVNFNEIHGIRVGTAIVGGLSEVNGIVFTEVVITVVDIPVELLGIDVRVITQIQASGPQTVSRLASSSLLVTTEQIFDFEGVQGTVVASAVFSDGTRILLDDSEVTFSSLRSSVVHVSGTNVTAVASGDGQIVQAVWNSPSECSSQPIATGIAFISVSIPRPTRVTVSISPVVLSAPGSTANFIGVPHSATLRVVASYLDGINQDLTTDPRTVYIFPDSIDLIMNGNVVSLTTNNNTTVNGNFSISVSLTQFEDLVENLTFSVVSATDIYLTANPYPVYSGSNSRNVSQLSLIANTSERQQALVYARAILSNGNSIDVSTNSELRLTLIASHQSLQDSALITRNPTTNVLSFRDHLASGNLTTSAALREVISSNFLHFEISTIPVQVTDIIISPFEDNTFRGIVNVAQHQIVVTAIFEDTTQYVNLFQDTMLHNLVTFEATPPTAITVDNVSGLATLRGNSLSLATITVSSINSPVRQNLNVACNLDPDVGDIDIGSRSGLPVLISPLQSQFSVPVQVNSGTSILDSIELDLTFDPSIIRAVTAVRGSDWPSTGQFLFNVDDPIDTISFGGTLVGSTPVRGSSLHLATILFEAIGAGMTNVTGVVHTLAEQIADGSSTNIGTVPRAFVAGSVQVMVTGSRQQRRSVRAYRINVPHSMFRRQSASACQSPPCDLCFPQRETGDVDGNCVFDVRDVSFLQLHVLTTVATGIEPPLPQDRRRFLDSDLNGRIDNNDVVFMLRVNFRLLRFASQPTFIPVESSGDSCQFSANITLVSRGDIPANNSSTALIFDIAGENPTFQSLFDSSNFTLGMVLSVSKGVGLYGGLVEAAYLGNGVYGIRVESALGSTFGVSPIQVTFDAEGRTSPVRTATLFSQGIPRYRMIDAVISLRGETVSVNTQLGYSPLVLANSSITTPECLLLRSPLSFQNTLYNISLPEDANIGDFVLMVIATSNKPSLSITYHISNVTTLPFRIDSTSGTITVNSPLDFESTSSYFFDVVATEITPDNESFTALAQVSIIVTNVNDLPPRIDPLPDTPILASQQIGEEVFRVIATDLDSLDTLTYSLTDASTVGLFSINASTGVVSIARSLMPHANTLITLNIIVSDGVFSTGTEVQVDIYLPSFSENNYSANISESSPIGSLLVQLSLVNTRGKLFTFESQDDRVRVNEDGIAILSTELDYEEEAIYNIIIAANLSDIVVVTTLTVNLRDENDNAPEFSALDYNVSIPASTLTGTSLIQLNATDRDSPGPNSDIEFSIVPDINSDFFRISAVTGEVTLLRPLLGGPSIVILNITATDNGLPSLSRSVMLTIEVESTGIPPFPIPPIIRTVGGVLTQSRPVRTTGNNSTMTIFHQAFTKLSSPLSGQLLASFMGSDKESSQNISTALQVATTATAHILYPIDTVHQENRTVILSFQLRDNNYFTHVDGGSSIVVDAILVGINERETSSPCNPDQFGICTTTISLPEHWFNLSNSIIVEPNLNGRAIDFGEEHSIPRILNLQISPSLTTAITNDVVIQLPSGDIVSGRSFILDVYGYSSFSISGFSIVFQTSASLVITDLIFDAAQWSIQIANGTGSFGISGILSSPNEVDTANNGGNSLLLSLQVLTNSRNSLPVTANITAHIQSLSNVVEGSVILGSSRTTSGPAQFLSRSGQGTVGIIHIVPNSIVAVYPYVQYPELLNTAVLEGISLSIPVLIHVGYLSGEVIPYNGGNISCLSSEPNVIDVNSDCSSILMTGRENNGSDSVFITFNIGSASGRLPLRVYFPKIPLLFVTTDRILNQIQYTESRECIAYQQASITIFTDFIASTEQSLSNISVTDIISPYLFISSSSVLGLHGNMVYGRSPGLALVCASRVHLGCIDITVSSEPVEIAGIVGSVLVEISIESSLYVNISSNYVASIQARSEFQFEQEQGNLLVAVQFTDGSVSTVNSTDVIILPSDSSLYAVADNNTILSRESGQTIGSFKWQPLRDQCKVEIIGIFLFISSLPNPIDIQTSLLPSPMVNIITLTNDPLVLLGTPTTMTIMVTLLFPNGQTLDVSEDSRVSFVPSSDTLQVINGVVMATRRASGNTQLIVGYSSNGVSLNVSLEFLVVYSTGISILPYPFPAYQGSTDNITTVLHPIEDTSTWQRAVLQLQLSLSNFTSVEVSGLPEATFEAATINGVIIPHLSSTNILSVNGSGIISVLANFSTLDTALLITVHDTPVFVTAARIIPLQSNTLRGIMGTSSHQLSVDLTFSDGTQLLSYPDNPDFSDNFLPGIITYNTSSNVFSVSDTGLLQPLANSHSPVSVFVTAGSNSIPSTESFVVNLDPDIGDVDIGMVSGAPFPDSSVGDEVTLPLMVNTGGRNLGSIDIIVTYDPAVISPLEVTLGTMFGPGVHESSLNDPPGEIRLGGALSSDVSGFTVHLFNLRFRVIRTSSSGVSFLSGSVVTFAERDLVGTPIGLPTPRAIIAGNITFTITGNSKRSVVDTSPLSSSQTHFRYRRQVLCPTPPCSCSGTTPGDADGNCVFDIRDVSFTLIYIANFILDPSLSQENEILSQITVAQMKQLDPNQDGVIDSSDAFFLLRALFRLVYFLESVRVVPVQDPSSACLFTVQIQLTSAQDLPLGSVEVFVDFGFISPSSSDDFSNSVLLSGELITTEKGTSLMGGIILAQLASDGLFIITINSSFISDSVGVSIITVTFDAQNSTSSSRSVQFFGGPPLLYPFPLNLNIPTRNTQFLIAASFGYSPFIIASNTLLSSQCSDVPLLEPELNVTFISPFQAEFNWRLLNVRMGLNFTASLQLVTTACRVDQSRLILNETCIGPNNTTVNEMTSHSLPTSPFTTYYFQVQAPTSSTQTVEIISPEALPTGVSLPQFNFQSDGVYFQWGLPASPNGVITHYTLYIGTEVVFNGSAFTFFYSQIITEVVNFTLEAHNSAGTGSSQTGLVSPLAGTDSSPLNTLTLAIEEAIIISVVVTTLIIIVLLLIMMCGMTRKRRMEKVKKRPAFLSSNFEAENIGVVSFIVNVDVKSHYLHTLIKHPCIHRLLCLVYIKATIISQREWHSQCSSYPWTSSYYSVMFIFKSL